ncbi:MAG: ParB/RepB/Spo0J family partition protein [Bergeyella sp.]|nr:ParB/RepB/Spo0J family partition protein [Bergeyella sp.]
MGRGLGAILTSESRVSVHSVTDKGAESLVGNIIEVPIEDIYPNASQPRSYFDPKALEELAQSIKNLGVIQPITLRKEKDKFEIISGERRYRASKLAGLTSVPAYIRLVNDQELLEMALVENIQREDLDAIEVALTYQRLLEEIGMTQEDLSKRVGKERSTITNSIRLLKLPPDMQEAIRTSQISAGHGRALLSLEDEILQKKLFSLILSKKLNVRQTEKAANDLRKSVEEGTSVSGTQKVFVHHEKIRKNLSDLMSVGVQIKSSADGKKGKIVLDFKNEKELEQILSHIQ